MLLSWLEPSLARPLALSWEKSKGGERKKEKKE
jgi:hypothetical protein